ncbi:MFS transporter [Terrilactibacillus laevilacticus]|uniref:MFS transporter n=1 Tax=Terrilactibacillus laevilacticus TaxID=1380157 RepID=UPI001146A820|nr:MFS transporter [Terrilactibacillus laevilacticus]
MKKRQHGSNQVPRDLLLLLVIVGLYFLSISLSNTFVNIYMWKQSKSFINIGLYNLMIVIFQPLMFLVGGQLAKKVDRIIVLRLGIISLGCFFITVLLLGSKASSMTLLLGSIIGMGFGFFWLAFNVLTFEVTNPSTRDFFNGYSGLLSSFSGIICPFSAGWIISKMSDSIGYKIVFAISLLLFGLAIFVSFFLKKRPASGVLAFRTILNERKNNKYWRAVLRASVSQGLRDGVYLFIVVIWIYSTTNSEFALGTFGLVESSIMSVGYFLATKVLKPKYRKRMILIGSLLMYMGILLIVFDLNFRNLMIYAVFASSAYPLLLVPFLSMTYDVIGKGWKAGDYRIEYIVVKELFYNSGRICSITVFLICMKIFGSSMFITRVIILLAALGYVGIYFFVRKIPIPITSMKSVSMPNPQKGKVN